MDVRFTYRVVVARYVVFWGFLAVIFGVTSFWTDRLELVGLMFFIFTCFSELVICDLEVKGSYGFLRGIVRISKVSRVVANYRGFYFGVAFWIGIFWGEVYYIMLSIINVASVIGDCDMTRYEG